MQTMMLAALLDTLAQVGKPAEVLTTAAGARIAVLPYGGRVLGLAAPGSDENFLWVNPALATAAGARDFYASGEWHNSGGERHWIAPEAGFFFPEWPRTDVYLQPRQVDPGKYSIERAGAGIRLVNRFALHSYRTGADVGLVLTKLVEPAATLLLTGAAAVLADRLSYAGYTVRSTLDVVDGGGATPVGLWSLLQLPHGGDMLIATHAPAQPVVYFGQPAESGLAVEERLVRWKMCAAGEHKLGLRAAACTGSVGYLWPAGGQWQLVVRSFAVKEDGRYIDAPVSGPAEDGCAFQACSVNSARFGSFSELEYHAPAIGGPGGASQCEDVSHVWAFRGPEEAVRAAARMLLGE